MNALGLVELDQLFGPRHGGRGVKTQPGIDLGGHPARDDGQDLAAKAHQQSVHLLRQRVLPKTGDGLDQQRPILGLLHCFEDQRRVGGGVLRLVSRHLVKVAGVSHHGGELFERVKLVHGVCPVLELSLKQSYITTSEFM